MLDIKDADWCPSSVVALEYRLHDADDEFNVESVNPDLEDESMIGDADIDGQESPPLAEVRSEGSNPSASQQFLDIKGPESLGATSGPIPALTRADLYISLGRVNLSKFSP